MGSLQGIALVAFDMFGTLARNEMDEWRGTVRAVARDQGLGVDGDRLWTEWRKHEIQFRKTRTNMDDPKGSPPFRTYWQAWRDAFTAAFASLGIHGDADAAATRCIEDHTRRTAFPDASPALAQLKGLCPLAVLSNADDRFLLGTIKHNGWEFDTVVSSEAARAYKPDPRIFLALCDTTGVAPEQVLYVGDSPYDDVHGAALAGMRTALVRREQPASEQRGILPLGRTPPPEEVQLLPPDYTIDSLEGL
ncbi:MAG: HAD-IA family hydrolase, partial [Dehalococcoidia bacterium]